jgi:hypothetical protein
VGWIDLAQDKEQWRALVNAIMNFRVQYDAEKFLSVCATDGFWSSAQLHRVSQLIMPILLAVPIICTKISVGKIMDVVTGNSTQ